MTRRLNRKTRVLSMNQYIHRATLGLSKTERLDAAAELRTHLLERISEYQAQGFAQEEAEYLSVKGMGEPQVTNRELLGHFLTTPLGWAVLAALIVGWAGWQIKTHPDQPQVQWGGLVDVNEFSNGGALPAWYRAYHFKTPPGTRFMQLAWIGGLGSQRAVLAAKPLTEGQVIVGGPTWREWWTTRTPLPYADTPWSKTCRNQQPVHLQMLVDSPNYMNGLHEPNSNLHGVLWCSGLPLPPTQKGITQYGGGSGTSKGSYVMGSIVEVQQADGKTDKGRLRLNHWTLLDLHRMNVKATYKSGQKVNVTGEALLVIRPSDSDLPAPLPQYRYDTSTDQWTVREVAP